VDGLVLPGGESTTIVKLARTFDLLEPLRARIKDGLPTYGSCAGMILLADRIDAGGPPLEETFGGIDISVRRNAFGRQVDSFEEDVAVDGIAGEPVHAVFIRAPWVEEVGPAATPLGRVAAGQAAGRVVAVRQQHLLATSFHPELTGDGRIHAYFVDMVKGARE
jgi:5'-phosphate synthase pdxT subunit